MKKIVLRSWRVIEGEPSGMFVWYDPTRESIELYELEPPTETGVVAFSEGDDQSCLRLSQSEVTDRPGEDDLPF